MKKRIVTMRQSLCWHEANAVLGGIELLASDKRLGYRNGEILDMFVLIRQEEITEDDEDDVKGPEVK